MARKTGIPILINPAGGSVGAAEQALCDIGSALAQAGVTGSPELLAAPAIRDRASRAVERGEPLLIVGGGDGTISAAASSLAGSETALGILPLGTRNHFARDLGIPIDLGKAAGAIADGHVQQVDIGDVNGLAFVNNSAIGLYPLLVQDRQSQQKRLGRSKRLAMAIAAVRTLAYFNRQRLTLTVNEEQARLDTPLLFVGNNRYRLALPEAGRRETLDDGELYLVVLRNKTRRGFVAAALRALIGRPRFDDMIRVDGVRRLCVTCARRLAVSVDGEAVDLSPPLDYRIRPRALKVIVPQEKISQAM